MKRILILIAVACALALALAAQKKEKPWTEWSKKDAEKILTASPWAQTQVDTDTSEMFFREQPTPDTRTGGTGGGGAARDERGSLNQATDVKYRIRFFSARPVRRALARLALLNLGKPDAAAVERLRTFAEMQSNEKIIVSVSFESRDQRLGGPVMQSFVSATAGTLKNGTYLERRDGKRVFLEQYVPPGKEGYGALFVFPRTVAEGPVITPDGGEVRFVSEMSNKIKLDMKFKIAEMVQDGRLEY